VYLISKGIVRQGDVLDGQRKRFEANSTDGTGERSFGEVKALNFSINPQDNCKIHTQKP